LQPSLLSLSECSIYYCPVPPSTSPGHGPGNMNWTRRQRKATAAIRALAFEVPSNPTLLRMALQAPVRFKNAWERRQPLELYGIQEPASQSRLQAKMISLENSRRHGSFSQAPRSAGEAGTQDLLARTSDVGISQLYRTATFGQSACLVLCSFNSSPTLEHHQPLADLQAQNDLCGSSSAHSKRRR
jgi:hypothetical protein